jgi:hypothetical protein
MAIEEPAHSMFRKCRWTEGRERLAGFHEGCASARNDGNPVITHI